MLEKYLPTGLSRVALYLVAPLAASPFFIPASVFSDLRLSPETVQWFLRLGISATLLLVLAVVVLISVLYDCYHRSVDIRRAMEEGRQRANKT